MKTRAMALKEQETYVYIDVSNIRLACGKTLGKRIDFVRLLEYLQGKYVNLREVRYYEGIAKGDEKKRRMFEFLEGKGYVVCALERKAYSLVEVEKRGVKCPRCGNEWVVEFARERRAMKSNVDVYLATELLAVAHRVEKPTHIILVSCDGDYAEMIRNALMNENVTVSVLATPAVRDFARNTLSVRLRIMRGELPRYHLIDIRDIIDLVAAEDKK